MRNEITVSVNGKSVCVPAGSTASTAVAVAGECHFRTSINGTPRGPLCGMGICFECRVTIDGAAHRRNCQTVCQPGMEIRTDAP